jgi:hypothetical protein
MVDEYWGYEKWQAFILPQREINHKCRKADKRGLFSFGLPNVT